MIPIGKHQMEWCDFTFDIVGGSWSTIRFYSESDCELSCEDLSVGKKMVLCEWSCL